MAYSYNGNVYPPLPSGYDDKPFAIIVSAGDDNQGSLHLSDRPFCAYKIEPGVYLLGNNTSEGILYCYFQLSVGFWDYWETNILAIDRVIGFGTNFLWANYDVYDEEGNLFLAGSDPVPVGLTIRCPDSVEQGLFIGIACDSLDEKYVDFTCELSGNTSPQTRLIQYNSYTARLECAKDEAAGSLTITVASVDDPGLTGTKDIAVVPRDWTYPDDDDPGGGGGGGGGGWDETSLVTGIDLHVYPETVVPGGRATVEVSVNGIGNYSQAFTARLSGNGSPETELLSAGNSCNVWIAEEETAEYVLVTVASVQDPTITATEMIYIDYSGTEDEGTTQEQLQRAFWKGFAAARAYFQEAKVSASASIHIAREEAEPTTKAGKLRRSFWQGFVSALIVAAAETAPETVPDGVLISSDGYILTDCNGVYLIASADVEPEQPGSPDVPSDEPIAYLYNGIQLPALPEWDWSTYPFAYIAYKENIGYVFAVSGTERHANDLKTMMVFGNDYTRKLVDGEWVAAGGGTGFSPVWGNYDICYANDLDTVIVPKSDPIPVYEK